MGCFQWGARAHNLYIDNGRTVTFPDHNVRKAGPFLRIYTGFPFDRPLVHLKLLAQVVDNTIVSLDPFTVSALTLLQDVPQRLILATSCPTGNVLVPTPRGPGQRRNRIDPQLCTVDEIPATQKAGAIRDPLLRFGHLFARSHVRSIH